MTPETMQLTTSQSNVHLIYPLCSIIAITLQEVASCTLASSVYLFEVQHAFLYEDDV